MSIAGGINGTNLSDRRLDFAWAGGWVRGEGGSALVRFNFLTPASASLNTLSEEHVERLELAGNAVKVEIRSNELMTIRVR